MSTYPYPIKRIALPSDIVELLAGVEGPVVFTDESDREVARTAIAGTSAPITGGDSRAATPPIDTAGVVFRPSGIPVILAPAGTPTSTIDIVDELRRDREVRGLRDTSR